MRLLAVFAAVGLIFAGVWLDYRNQTAGTRPERAESGRAESAGTKSVPGDPEETRPGLPGFRADLGQLPDDPLLGFVEIPAGPFLMGSDPAIDTLAYDIERWSPGRPQGTVEVPAFFIGRGEVTVAQFRAFSEGTGYEADPQTLAGPPLHPVSFVSWPDALAYCRWLEELLRESPATPPELRRLLTDGWRVTLPTEAQWEKAARGDDGRIFPWGNELRADRANFATGRPAPVGEMACRECPYGLGDMSGNVWEWTRSPWQPYPYDEADDREGLEGDALWVMRGGSFSEPVRNVRAAIRGAAGPDVRREFIGFRVVIARR
ncbi:MAG: SUMF1/EgtB/PvdO family nonheme iron enzyme [Gammaproteobacteria bacterium]|nr:SUMF1/EgtB/PvdO family nonheme iron enzyme [Gammaproteobacteria bacterium]